MAACVWDYAEGMTSLRAFWDAAVSLDPDARAFHEGMRFPICRPAALESLFRGAGLDSVEVAPLVVPTPFEDFDDFWAPFVSGPGSAPTYLASLPEARQRALSERLRADLSADGRFSRSFTARAWAVRGTAPSRR